MALLARVQYPPVLIAIQEALLHPVSQWLDSSIASTGLRAKVNAIFADVIAERVFLALFALAIMKRHHAYASLV